MGISAPKSANIGRKMGETPNLVQDNAVNANPNSNDFISEAARLTAQRFAQGVEGVKSEAKEKIGSTVETAVLTALRNYGGLIVTPIQLALSLPGASTYLGSYIGPIFKAMIKGDDIQTYMRFLQTASNVANRDPSEIERLQDPKASENDELKKLENKILVEGFAANPDIYFTAIARNLVQVAKSGNLLQFKEKLYGLIPSSDNPVFQKVINTTRKFIDSSMETLESFTNPDKPQKASSINPTSNKISENSDITKNKSSLWKKIDSGLESLVSKVTPEGNIRKYGKWGILGVGAYVLVTKVILPLFKWLFYAATAFFGVKAAGKIFSGGNKNSRANKENKGVLESAQEGLKGAAKAGSGLIRKGHGFLDTVDKMTMGLSKPFTEPAKQALETAHQVVSPAAA